MLGEPNKRRAMAAALGALANASRLDTALPLPRGVHWAVAGGASTVLIDGSEAASYDTLAMDAALGYMGGWMLSYARRAVPFVGRLLGS